MQSFYDQLKDFKKRNGLSYGDLGSIINKGADAFRQAVNRESLSDLEKEKLEQVFAGGEIQNKEKPSEVRVEDVIADKILLKLRPEFNQIHAKLDALLEFASNYDLDMDDLKEVVEDTKREVIKLQ